MSKKASSRLGIVVGGIIGNVMEWYDFSVYGYFASTIGHNFFPAKNPISSLLAAFGVFAAGFLMRPLGSLVFGHIGDKQGRTRALTISVALMAAPTFLIGALPSYHRIGVWASALLVLMRLLQGLSVGGEYTTSSIFLVEKSAGRHRGFLGSFVPLGSIIGVLLGSAIGAAVTTLLDHAAVVSWGWRIPFLIGITIGGCGFLFRLGLADDRPARSRHETAAAPVREALRTEWPAILRLIGLNAVGAVGFYMAFVYVTTYLHKIDHLPQSKALDINTISMVVLLVLTVPAGALSDRIGRKPVLLVASGGMLVLSWPLFWLLDHPDFRMVLLGQIGFAVLSACFWGTNSAAMVELVPDRLRCTVISFGYNTGLAILGGLTPLVAVYTVNRSRYDLSPAFLLMAAAAISFFVVLRLRETYRIPLPGPAIVAADAA